MVKALVLDIRINSAQHVVVGTLTLIVLLVCAAFGVLTPFWLFVAMWLGGLSAAHRDLRRLGDIARLQSVLGVPCAEAVRARYLSLAGAAALVLVATGVVAGLWSALGRDLSTALVVPPLVAAIVAVCAVRLTLGYCASPAWQQGVTATLVGLVMSIGLLPFLGGADLTDSTRGLVGLLYDGAVPLALVLALAALAALLIGYRFAAAAHARTDL